MKKILTFISIAVTSIVLTGCAKEPNAQDIKAALDNNVSQSVQGSGTSISIITVDKVEKLNDCEKEKNIYNCNVSVEVTMMGMKQKRNMTAKLTTDKKGNFVLLQE